MSKSSNICISYVEYKVNKRCMPPDEPKYFKKIKLEKKTKILRKLK
jgi:hypothetical protein